MTWLLKPLLWLIRLCAGSAVAREAGQQDAVTDAAQTALAVTTEVKNAQAKIAARPAAGPDAVLDRMRHGDL